MKNTLETHYAQWMFKNFSAAERRRIWIKLGTLMKNGVALMQAIGTLKTRRIDNNKQGHPGTIALIAWEKSLNDGERLSTAIDQWVSKEEAMLIAAGEISGALIEALQSAAKLMVAKKEIVSALASGMVYPFILVLMAFGVLYQFGFKIIPAFVNSSHGLEWRGMAKVMIAMSNFSQHWLWLVAVILVVVVSIFFITLPHFDGGLRVKLDRVAPYSVYRIMHGSTWLIATGALIKAGLQGKAALEQLEEGASPWLKRRLHACLSGINSGLPMGDALLASGFEFPDREIIEDLCVYSSLSGLDKALSDLGDEWLGESVVRIKAQMTAVFGIAIVGVGGLVATMVTGMIEMQIQLSTVMQHLTR